MTKRDKPRCMHENYRRFQTMIEISHHRGRINCTVCNDNFVKVVMHRVA